MICSDYIVVTEGSDELDIESDIVPSLNATDSSTPFPVQLYNDEDSDIEEGYDDYDMEVNEPDVSSRPTPTYVCKICNYSKSFKYCSC